MESDDGALSPMRLPEGEITRVTQQDDQCANGLVQRIEVTRTDLLREG